MWGEVWWRWIPLHRDSEVWGGLDGVCPTLQRLPTVVPWGAAAGEQPLSCGHWLSRWLAHAWQKGHWVGRRAEPSVHAEERKRLTYWPSGTASLLSCCLRLFGDKERSSWMLPSSMLAGLQVERDAKRNVSGLPFLQMRNFQVLNVADPVWFLCV